MNGVILIHKEKDFTSFDVVAVVRKLTGQKKVGHTGTLDPNATGVLPVLLGTATKAQDIIPCHDKRYRADFRFGIATDTLDIWGKVIEQQPSDITEEQIERALGSLRGEIEQLPPMYSAVSVDGKRLYQYAREGKSVERRPRTVTVYTLELLCFDEAAQSGRLDIARLADAITLDELKTITENGGIDENAPYYRSVESLFAEYPELVVSEKQAHRFKNGNPLDVARTEAKNTAEKQKIYRVKDREGNFLSLGIIQDDMIKLYKHF